MLILSRKPCQTVVIDGHIRVTVVEVKGGRVRLAVAAPARVRVDREEVAGRRATAGGEPAAPILALG